MIYLQIIFCTTNKTKYILVCFTVYLSVSDLSVLCGLIVFSMSKTETTCPLVIGFRISMGGGRQTGEVIPLGLVMASEELFLSPRHPQQTEH